MNGYGAIDPRDWDVPDPACADCGHARADHHGVFEHWCGHGYVGHYDDRPCRCSGWRA